MPSLDIVSQVDLQEVDNAVNQAQREVGQRFDFKGSATEISRDEAEIKVVSSDEFKVKSAVDVLCAKLARREVPLKSLEYGTIEATARGRAAQTIQVRQGIDADHARRIVKLIKADRRTVQPRIQGDVIRVSGKKRDDLQAVIRLVKGADLDLALQFVNFRD